MSSTGSIVEARTGHTRHRPMVRTFQHRLTMWLIDLDAGLVLPGWAAPFVQVRAEDHLSGPADLQALKDNVRRVVERELGPTQIDRVLMLSAARTGGHVFDPMSMFWCLDSAGDHVAAVVEVHNTYGERHAYVLPPPGHTPPADDGDGTRDDHGDNAIAGVRGTGEVDKRFYVSPFNDVSGRYRVRHRLDRDRVHVTVALHDEKGPLFTATVAGPVAAVTSRAVARAAVLGRLLPLRTSALIRAHGIWLWLRRLPVRPRPHHTPESVL